MSPKKQADTLLKGHSDAHHTVPLTGEGPTSVDWTFGKDDKEGPSDSRRVIITFEAKSFHVVFSELYQRVWPVWIFLHIGGMRRPACQVANLCSRHSTSASYRGHVSMLQTLGTSRGMQAINSTLDRHTVHAQHQSTACRYVGTPGGHKRDAAV